MVKPIISVARHRPRKNSTTNTTKSNAYAIDSFSESIEFSIVSDES